MNAYIFLCERGLIYVVWIGYETFCTSFIAESLADAPGKLDIKG